MKIFVPTIVSLLLILHIAVALNKSDCKGNINCLIHPDGCTTDCKILSWKPAETDGHVEFQMSRPNVKVNEYIAFAFGPDYEMVDADMYFCTFNGNTTQFGIGAIQAQFGMPQQELYNTTTGNLVGVQHSYADGKLLCKFTRPYSVTKTISGGKSYDFDILNEKYFIMWAQGAIDADGLMLEHAPKPARGHTNVLANLSAPASGSEGWKLNFGLMLAAFIAHMCVQA